MLSCVIIDDEPLAREGLSSYVREVDFLHLTGTAENPLELISLLEEQLVDLIFLDIQMPKMSGIEFLKIVPNPPMVILTTAYPSFALDGFQLNVLDYLLKPITFERFVQSAHKARTYHRLVAQASSAGSAKNVQADANYVFVKCGNRYEKLVFDELLYVEGLQNYVTIYTTKGNYVTLLTLSTLEQNLAEHGFVRVHKSYIVNTGKIDGIEGHELFLESHRIPISRHYRDRIMQAILVDKVWKK